MTQANPGVADGVDWRLYYVTDTALSGGPAQVPHMVENHEHDHQSPKEIDGLDPASRHDRRCRQRTAASGLIVYKSVHPLPLEVEQSQLMESFLRRNDPIAGRLDRNAGTAVRTSTGPRPRG